MIKIHYSMRAQWKELSTVPIVLNWKCGVCEHEEPTWHWCWCRWCTRSHQSTGSGRWSCWFGSTSTPCSSSGNDTWPTKPDPSASLPAEGGTLLVSITVSNRPLLFSSMIQQGLKERESQRSTVMWQPCVFSSHYNPLQSCCWQLPVCSPESQTFN